MARRAVLRFGLLAVFCSLPCSVFKSAQFPFPPERCSVPVRTQKAITTWRKVIVKRIEFDGPIHLSQSDVAQIIKEANHQMLDADDPEWIKEFTESSLREAWLTRGYFKVKVNSQARSLGGNSSEGRFLVSAHVDEGLQYRLRDIRFRSLTDIGIGGDSTISEAELRAAIPIRDGEIFNVALIRTGIEALTKLYGSHGYIDFTAVPDTGIDDDQRPWISLVFTLDLQKQFRVGKVVVIGLDPKLEPRLTELIHPGEIFNSEVVEDFLTEIKAALPSGFSIGRDVSFLRNFKAGIVDLTFDFRTCP
jgi:outer membrane protein assembly factor BamA